MSQVTVDPRTAPGLGASRALGRARRRGILDRVARGLVTAGGFAVIGSIIGILLFLVYEIEPLLRGAQVWPERAGALAARARSMLVDEHRTHLATLSADGFVRVYRLRDGGLTLERAVAASVVSALAPAGDGTLVGLDATGSALFVPVDFEIRFEGRERRVEARVGEPLGFPLGAGRSVRAFTGRRSAESAIALGQLPGGEIVLARRTLESNPFTGETRVEIERRKLPAVPPLARMVLDPEQRFLYAAVAGGGLLWWDLEGRARASTPGSISTGGRQVTALALLNGGRGLVVGDASGGLSVWFLVPQPDRTQKLERIRDFPPHAAPIGRVAVSERGRSFLAHDTAGGLGLYYSTSERVLWRGESPLRDASALAFAPKGDGAAVADGLRFAEIGIESPHPETSAGIFFGKVWYEGAPEPAYVWQSTGGTDEFEPKLSLVPLLVGTLKGTFYSLLLAVPLAVFAAMYTSQFMHPTLQRWIKPTVELMASLPSVVLGFLAGLWLAPRIEAIFPALILMSVGLPLAVVAGGYAWGLLPATLRRRLPDGIEVGWLMIVALVASAVFLGAGPAFEGLAFGGSFQSWLLETSGLRYDQRNAIVIGLAMGLAVIPVIFAIAEDSFSNVPADLLAGSRALGATRLQTVLRVAVPTASPGIFSATMVGFGRAVGETMIVLMATGNTPILDWSPFNGFRTLSANIAVEIPEAPLGGTLYRTLFVAALLLFALTFLINTVAEVIRHRLRERYSRL